ncbi:MAG: hypothetical protein ACR2NP_03485 [Pirellulaceae bacterium]
MKSTGYFTRYAFLASVIFVTVQLPSIAQAGPAGQQTDNESKLSGHNQRTPWQLEQEWQETRDVESALKLLGELRDDPNCQLSEQQLLIILQLQLRFDDVDQAEATFNKFPDYVVNASDGQFPYPLTRKMGSRPDQRDAVESFINRPMLEIEGRHRQVGRDRINSWRVWSLAAKDKMLQAIDAARRISVQPSEFPEARHRNHGSNEYLSRSAWKSIFSAAIRNDMPDLALEVIEQFEFTSDRSDLLQYNEDEILALEASPDREALVEILRQVRGGRSLSYRHDKSNFARLLREHDFAGLESSLADFDDRPTVRMSRALEVMELYHEQANEVAVNRWLDRVVESAAIFRCNERKLLDLFIHMDRLDDAIAYFGPKSCDERKSSNVALNKQPLGGLAIEHVREGRLELAEQIALAIEDPVWRSGTLAAMSMVIDEGQPALAADWWSNSLKLLDEISHPKLHDVRLQHNGLTLMAKNRSAEAFELLAAFREPRLAARALAKWTIRALEQEALSTPMIRQCIDRVAELDARELENMTSHFLDTQDAENCIYVALRLRDDTDMGYFSYIHYYFQLIFERYGDTLTMEQITQIFDNQLPKHRGAVMANCLRALDENEQRRDGVVKQVLDRLDDCDVDLSLHNALMQIFVEQEDLDRLRVLLDRDVPDSQFLDDDPVSNSWRVSNHYTFSPERLAEKIGGEGMLSFAKSLKLARMRQVAYAQALFQMVEDEGIDRVESICGEIADPKERADTLLEVIDKYLTPPEFDSR